MKFKITTDEHAKLPDALKTEYEEKDGAFTLKLEGHEEAFVPKAKRDIEAEHRKTAEKNLAEAKAREEKLLKDLESAGGNKAELEKVRTEYAAQVEKIKTEYAEKEKAAKGEAHKAMIREEASKFAGEKFTIPSLISQAYAARLAVEDVDGVPVIRTREADGKPSVKSLDDLRKEFLENKEFAPIVKASQASGGGAVHSKGGGGAAKVATRTQFEAMPDAERLSFSKEGGQLTDG